MARFFLIIFLSFASTVVLFNYSISSDVCDPKEALLNNPQPDQLKRCLHSIWFSLGRKHKIDQQFTESLVEMLLPIEHSDHERLKKLNQFDVDYLKLAEIISLLRSEKLIKRYIDFIIFTKHSANELRTFGLGHLYTYQGPSFLELLSAYSREDQNTVIKRVAWGLANNFYPHMTKENYRRLIVGAHWEILQDDHPYRGLSQKIEKEISKILDYKSP
jgi:hypothetical protein